MHVSGTMQPLRDKFCSTRSTDKADPHHVSAGGDTHEHVSAKNIPHNKQKAGWARCTSSASSWLALMHDNQQRPHITRDIVPNCSRGRRRCHAGAVSSVLILYSNESSLLKQDPSRADDQATQSAAHDGCDSCRNRLTGATAVRTTLQRCCEKKTPPSVEIFDSVAKTGDESPAVS